MHIRGRIRKAIREAIAADGQFSGWLVLKSWGENVSDDDLPAAGVFTPRETSTLSTGSEADRITHVVVQARCRGNDDLEDKMDDASADLEALVLPLLAAIGETYELATTDIDIVGEGAARIGKLEMVFRVTRFTDEGQSE